MSPLARKLTCRARATGLLLALSIAQGCATSADPPVASQQQPTRVEGVAFPLQNRPDVRGTNGAVSSDHPLASAVGHDVLRSGGNAMDAAIAMAGVLAVVRPHMNGIGGDAFALFYDAETGEVTALNGSGRAGALAVPSFFADGRIPQTGAGSVSVPGAVAAWDDALARHGTRGLSELLQPAIGYARDGFPVSTRLASDFEAQGGSLNRPGRALYLPGGKAPPVGSLLKNPALASTLERIASHGKTGFYQGPTADALARFLEDEGGYLRAPDLARHESTWVEPLSVDYLDHTFLVLPPNTQGLAQLQLFEMAKAFDFKQMGHNSSSYLHRLIELKKMAFADRDRWVGDPDADVPLADLLDPSYLRARALATTDRAATEVAPGMGGPASQANPSALDDRGDTVYLTVVDQWGNAVSWIQSLFAGFGSGLLEPETGVMLQNRGALFTLEAGHPNRVGPGKRPYHTLTPMMALRDGDFAFTLGTPGGDSQPQSIIQIVHNHLLFDLTPQQAIEAPRFRSYAGLRIDIEDRVAADALEGLRSRGHRLDLIEGWTATFGGAQMILREPSTGTLTVASDPRREAYGIAH